MVGGVFVYKKGMNLKSKVSLGLIIFILCDFAFNQSYFTGKFASKFTEIAGNIGRAIGNKLVEVLM